MNRQLRFVILMLALPGFEVAAQTPASIAMSDPELLAVTSGKSWALSFYGNPDEPGVTQIWDFRTDGSLCARAGGSKPNDKCADMGKWKVADQKVCWELSWLGEAYGYKNACSQALKGESGRIKLIKESPPDLTFAVLRVL
jgi:hypothetical protein